MKCKKVIFISLRSGIWVVNVLETANSHHDFTVHASHVTFIGKSQSLSIE